MASSKASLLYTTVEIHDGASTLVDSSSFISTPAISRCSSTTQLVEPQNREDVVATSTPSLLPPIQRQDSEDGFTITPAISRPSSTVPLIQQHDLEKGIITSAPSLLPPVDFQYSKYVLVALVQRFYDYIRLDVLTTYRQLWLVVVASNLVAIVALLVQHSSDKALPLGTCINASMVNLTVSIMIRQDYMKNLMYHICWSVPHTAPLFVRNQFAKIYEHGGVHSGAAVTSLLWFMVFTGFLWTAFKQGQYSDAAVLTFDIILAILLVSIVLAAIPQFRRRHHNIFENIHRWAGWLGIALFWIALILFANDRPQGTLGLTLVKLPAFWLLLITSLHVIWPWLTLRRVPVARYERLSDHAIRLYFSAEEKVRALHGVNISDAPLREWHAFAAISDIDGSDNGATSAIISKAGDWTSKTIAEPKPYYYMRGLHVTGTLDVAQLFRSVVVMATGSGIGPCLALFGTMPRTTIRLIWSAPSPRETYGDKICDSVLRQDPRAIIWDTRQPGKRRPDLAQMSLDMYKESGSEAVFFISNRNLTKTVIRQLRLRGVNAFAPVFDS